ncbi:MAG TPA: hypothetical protein VGG57_00075 [Stellaceae bacterium]|jgi:hypothetical protein
MTQAETAAQIEEFMRRRGVTRCPTACAVPTHADLAESDRAKLRDYNEAREAARAEKLKTYRQPAAA